MGQTAHSSQKHPDLYEDMIYDVWYDMIWYEDLDQKYLHDLADVAQLHPTPAFFGLREDRGDLESLFGFVTAGSQYVRKLSYVFIRNAFLVLYT